jgi:hypothetical protein
MRDRLAGTNRPDNAVERATRKGAARFTLSDAETSQKCRLPSLEIIDEIRFVRRNCHRFGIACFRSDDRTGAVNPAFVEQQLANVN